MIQACWYASSMVFAVDITTKLVQSFLQFLFRNVSIKFANGIALTGDKFKVGLSDTFIEVGLKWN